MRGVCEEAGAMNRQYRYFIEYRENIMCIDYITLMSEFTS